MTIRMVIMDEDILKESSPHRALMKLLQSESIVIILRVDFERGIAVVERWYCCWVRLRVGGGGGLLRRSLIDVSNCIETVLRTSRRDISLMLIISNLATVMCGCQHEK